MKILVTVPRLSPHYNPEAICTTRLLAEFATCVEHIHVVTSTTHSPLEAIDNIRVTIVEDYERESLLERANRLINRYPEDGWSWARRASFAVKALQSEVDLIYSRGVPFAAHLAVWFAKPVIPWIAHFSDPWPQWPEKDFGKDCRGWRYLWHSRIAQVPDAFTFSCDRVGKVCREEQWQNARQRPYFSIPHIASDEEPSPIAFPNRSSCEILHTGSFYLARKPDVFLRAWAEFISVGDRRERFKFTHVGNRCERIAALIDEFGLHGTVRQTGVVSFEQACANQSSADVLLMVESQESRKSIYLPSKFIDYLWAGKPVLALTPKEGTISDLLGTDYPLRADPWDVGAVRHLLELLDSQFDTDLVGHSLMSCQNRFRPKVVCNSLRTSMEQVFRGTA